jgi:hypothetical protein
MGQVVEVLVATTGNELTMQWGIEKLSDGEEANQLPVPSIYDRLRMLSRPSVGNRKRPVQVRRF